MSFETLPPFYKVFGDLFVSNAHLPKQLPEFGFEVIETFNSGKWNEKVPSTVVISKGLRLFVCRVLGQYRRKMISIMQY